MRPLIRLFGWLQRGAARELREALADPAGAQDHLRQRLLWRLEATDYGRAHGLSVGAGWERLPLVEYPDLEPWIARQRACEGPVLTPDRVRCYEKTSGSTGEAKWIPYTGRLLTSFGHMFQAWAHDLVAHGPPLRTGKLYFLVSPQLAPLESTERGVPVGLESDADYLPGWLRWLLAPFLVGPRDLGRERDPARFLDRLSRALLAEPDLEILSLWNPSLFTVLIEFIAGHREELLRDLHPHLTRPRRIALERWPDDLPGVWPELKLVSCWTQGEAAFPAARLHDLLPGVCMQGKGLLATEAPLTLPLEAAGGCLPLPHEVLYEFLDSRGELFPLTGVRDGEEYQLVLSQFGGLTRYRLGDRVRVRGRYLGTPMLEFLGRSGGIVDLVGEKLHPGFVSACLDRLPLVGARVRCLLPIRRPSPGYLLLLDRLEEGSPESLARMLDEELQRGHHYAHARRLGQLLPARVQIDLRAAELLLGASSSSQARLGARKHRDLAPPRDQAPDPLRLEALEA